MVRNKQSNLIASVKMLNRDVISKYIDQSITDLYTTLAQAASESYHTCCLSDLADKKESIKTYYITI